MLTRWNFEWEINTREKEEKDEEKKNATSIKPYIFHWGKGFDWKESLMVFYVLLITFGCGMQKHSHLNDFNWFEWMNEWMFLSEVKGTEMEILHWNYLCVHTTKATLFIGPKQHELNWSDRLDKGLNMRER